MNVLPHAALAVFHTTDGKRLTINAADVTGIQDASDDPFDGGTRLTLEGGQSLLVRESLYDVVVSLGECLSRRYDMHPR